MGYLGSDSSRLQLQQALSDDLEPTDAVFCSQTTDSSPQLQRAWVRLMCRSYRACDLTPSLEYLPQNEGDRH